MTQLGDSHDASWDQLLRDRIWLLQRKRGYRTSVDAMLLAWFAAMTGSYARFVDLGAGSGLVSILLARHRPEARALLVEKQPGLAARCRENLARNRVAERCDVVLHDVVDGAPPPAGSADLVVCNPPFHQQANRMLPTDAERLMAHYETSASIAAFASSARAALHHEGRSCWIYPKYAASRLREALHSAGLRAGAMHDLQHRPGHVPVTRVLVVARVASSGTLEMGPPLSLHPKHHRDDEYVASIEQFLATI